MFRLSKLTLMIRFLLPPGPTLSPSLSRMSPRTAPPLHLLHPRSLGGEMKAS